VFTHLTTLAFRQKSVVKITPSVVIASAFGTTSDKRFTALRGCSTYGVPLGWDKEFQASWRGAH
jgi:hypothetical protein